MAAAFRASGAWAIGTTTVAPAIPTGSAAGDRMVLFVGTKPFNATINTPSGWTALADSAGNNGSVANAVDAGSVRWASFYRDWVSGDAAPSVGVTTGNVSLAVIQGFSKGTNDTWDTPVAGKGSDNTSGTGFSITSDVNLGISNGDILCHGAVIAGNNATFATPTLTATGVTFGTVTESPATEGTTTGGNDLEASASYAIATAGPSSAAPVAGWTLSLAQTGGGSFVRLRASVALAANITLQGGLTWTANNMPATGNYAIAFGAGLFVAVNSGSATYYTSPDGISWTTRTLPVSASWSDIKFANGYFLVLPNVSGSVYYSTDGISWTAGASLPARAGSWLALGFGNGVWVAVGDNSATICATSSDNGATWTSQTYPTGLTYRAVAYGAGLFVAVGTSDAVMTSPTGVTWTDRTGGGLGTTWQDLVFDGTAFVATGGPSGNGSSMRSTNGTSWTQTVINPSANVTGVATDGASFIAVQNGIYSVCQRSTDGINFSSVSYPSGISSSSIAFGANTWVAAPNNTTSAYMYSAGGAGAVLTATLTNAAAGPKAFPHQRSFRPNIFMVH